MKAPRELILVVPHDLRARGRDKKAQADGRGHLAVTQVMRDLASRPFARRRRRVEFLIRRASECLGDDAIAILVLIDQRLATISIHASPPYPRVFAMPGAAASCSVGSMWWAIRCARSSSNASAGVSA